MAGNNGLASPTAMLVLDHINRGIATGITFTTSHNCLFLSTVRTANDNSLTPDVEWATFPGGNTNIANGYVAGTGQPITFAAATSSATLGATASSSVAVTQTNCPAVSWAGNRVMDKSATPKVLWYAPLTGGAKAINQGDTCTIQLGQFTTNLG